MSATDPTDPQLWERVLDGAAEAEDPTAAPSQRAWRRAAGGVIVGEEH